MKVSSKILIWFFCIYSYSLSAQVMQLRDNEDLAIYGDAVTEFTWVPVISAEKNENLGHF